MNCSTFNPVMTNKVDFVINQILEPTSTERANIVEKLLISSGSPSPSIDAIWAKEADTQIEAYERGELETISAEEVFHKYNQS